MDERIFILGERLQGLWGFENETMLWHFFPINAEGVGDLSIDIPLIGGQTPNYPYEISIEDEMFKIEIQGKKRTLTFITNDEIKIVSEGKNPLSLRGVRLR